MASLKANKVKQHSPSKAEIILHDNVKLALADMVGEANLAYGLHIKHVDAGSAYQSAEKATIDPLYSYLKKAQPDYNNWLAIKKHFIQSIADSKGRSYETVENWFSRHIVKGLKALGFEPPKAESKAAQGMSALRAELASISDTDLVSQIAELAKAGDKDSLKRATQLAGEKVKREKQAENAIKKADSKATTELKNALKRWIAGADSETLTALLWAKNHQAQIIKLSKA